VNIFTFGYGNRAIFELAPLVFELRPFCVIDVRLRPWTRQPGWSLPELKAQFAGEYHWWRSLGNVNFEKGGKVKLFDERKGMKKLVALMRQGISPILLCAEQSPDACHRTLIAEKLAALTGDAQVIHLPFITDSPTERVDEQLALWPRTRAGPKLPRLPTTGSKRTQKRPDK